MTKIELEQLLGHVKIARTAIEKVYIYTHDEHGDPTLPGVAKQIGAVSEIYWALPAIESHITRYIAMISRAEADLLNAGYHLKDDDKAVS